MKTLLFLVLFFLGGCASVSLNNNVNQEPQWITHIPKDQNFVYGLGVAPPNFNGKDAQRKSAISKALTEIAYQLGVEVNSEALSSQEAFNSSVNNYFKLTSLQKVKNKDVKAEIVHIYKNPQTGYLYVLMRAKRLK